MARLVLAAALALALCCRVSADAFEPQGFIKVCNGQFADEDGRVWYFSGWNGYTDLLNDAYNYLYNGASDNVTSRLRTAKAAGLTAIRIWGHGDGVVTLLQTQPGVYNETVFRSLDYVVNQARQFNIRLLVSLTTYWQNGDGIISYARWAGLTYAKLDNSSYYTQQYAAKDGFWNDTECQQYYKNNMRALFTRNNTFSGIQYQDDYAIFGWDLFNEPRCPANQTGTPCTSTLTDWGNMMFAYAKSLNKNQLFTFGEEGFFAEDALPANASWWQSIMNTWYVSNNPYGVPSNVEAGWAGRVGQDFASQNANGDFMEFHLWPSNWQTLPPSFAKTWIQAHVDVCKAYNLPCVLGEFGRALGAEEGNATAIASTRNPYFAAVYQTVQAEVQSKAPLSGDLFWQWVDPQNVGEQNGIVDTDSTFTQLIEPHAQFMQNHSGAVIC